MPERNIDGQDLPKLILSLSLNLVKKIVYLTSIEHEAESCLTKNEREARMLCKNSGVVGRQMSLLNRSLYVQLPTGTKQYSFSPGNVSLFRLTGSLRRYAEAFKTTG